MKETKIIVWSIIAITLTAMLLSLIISNGRMGFSLMEDYRVVYEDTISSENIENLNIDWHSGNVNVYASNNDEIKITQKARADLDENQRVQVTNSNKTLTLKEGKNKLNFFFIGFGSIGTVLDVYLPEKVYNEVILKCTSGEIYVSTISCTTFKSDLSSGEIDIDNIITEKTNIDVTSGEININKIEANTLDLKTTSGSIMITGSAKDVNLRTTSGEIYFENDILPESLDADVTSGNIEIIIPENDGFNVEYKITSGDFDSDFDLYSSLSNSGTSKYKDGGNTFTFKVTSGRINLERK